MTSRHVLLSAAALGSALRLLGAADAPDKASLEFFETKIRPVLADKCYSCHSAESKKLKGHLYLDSRDGMVSGGDSGPAVVPGEPEKSKLIEALRYKNEDLQMPPKEQLPEAVVQDFAAWVKMGAPDPRTGAASPAKPNASLAIAAAAKTHWAFQMPVAAPVPTVKNAAWVKTPIDALVAVKLEAKGLKPAPPADKATLLRRATVDLTGVPPTAEELAAFAADTAPDAFAKAVDRLLASPRYGERWGRHWLDVARYADTKGYVFEEDRHYPFSYTYRDWVIRAINEDLPYDRFLVDQLAADQVVQGDDKRDLAALGFLTLGRRFLNQQPDIIDDRIDVVCRGTMALTAACARCHDHKFDPIPTKDYYSLYGVFENSTEPKDLPLLGAQEKTEQTAAYEHELAKAQGEVDAFIAKRFGEVLGELRSEKKLAEYLLAARDAAALNDKDFDTLAQKRNLRHRPLRRWADRLKQAKPDDAVFSAWLAYAALHEGEFAAKAAAVKPAGTPNPLIAAAFAGAPPASLKEVAERYAKAIAAQDGEQPAGDPAAEALRQLLRAGDGPITVAVGESDQVFDGDDHKKIRDLRKKVDELVSTHPGSPPRAMVLQDVPNPHNPHVFIRGNAGNRGDEVPRQFLGILAGPQRKPFSKGSGRLELAQAIASKDNPLTARVFVNRVWLHHFGAGLVRTPSDFGLRSDTPANRELLDWLALRFIADGWSLKKLHRLIMTSAVYQQASDNPAVDAKIDPDNSLWWRFNRQRLDFEALRDSVLAVCGDLDPAMGGRAVDLTTQPYTTRRTVYGLIDRQNLANVFRTFDFASPDAHSPQRFQTSVPQQALFLMNSPFVIEQARKLAKRSDEPGAQSSARIQRLHRLVYGRAPTPAEIRLAEDFVAACAKAPAEPPVEPPSPWQYGFGRFDDEGQRVTDFTPLPHFAENSWRATVKLPAEKTGWVNLTAGGGHPGPDAAHAAIRRWVAPIDGVIAIAGKLVRPAKSTEGDGVRGRAISSRGGLLEEWKVKSGEADTAVGRVAVKRGDKIDFAVDCIGNDGFDSFEWAPTITAIEGGDGEWAAARQFSGPPAPPQPPLSPWEKYAQVLLMTNEFAFVD
jgi:hypothetical protein